VTNSELHELERRLLNVMEVVGVEEVWCPELQKRWDESGKKFAHSCRYDCGGCGGLGKVVRKMRKE
jgi:hypothetical protein